MSAFGFTTQNRILTAAGASDPVQIIPPARAGLYSHGYLQPSVLVLISNGASLTYNIEVTGDNIQSPIYVADGGFWVPFTGASGLTATTALTIGAAITAIRLNVTNYTSGTATMQVVQCLVA